MPTTPTPFDADLAQAQEVSAVAFQAYVDALDALADADERTAATLARAFEFARVTLASAAGKEHAYVLASYRWLEQHEQGIADDPETHVGWMQHFEAGVGGRFDHDMADAMGRYLDDQEPRLRVLAVQALAESTEASTSALVEFFAKGLAA